MNDDEKQNPASNGVGSTDCSAWMSEREHDLMIALRQLCDATRKQAAAVKGESIMVRMKRLAAEKMLSRYESTAPNVNDEPRDLYDHEDQ